MRVLVVDLNNFAMYPSIAIGYIVAELRQSGIDVEVLSPLSMGSMGVAREPRTPIWGALDQRARYCSAVSQSPTVTRVRNHLARRHLPKLARDGTKLVNTFQERISKRNFDAVLISTYLMYYDVCHDIGRLCAARGIPLVVGGSYFAQPEVAADWMPIPGLAALVGGEVEPHIADLVRSVVAGEPIDEYPGVWKRGEGGLSINSPPLAELDKLTFPDYSDFPWQLYKNTIVPMITGRGCGWGRCTFCSDITSTAGRTFRSRSPENVLEEIRMQAARHNTHNFVFTDLKLNSNPAVWESLLCYFQKHAPNAQWVASVHAGAGGKDCLSKEKLEAARSAGMVRLTTGLESGSQRVLNLMKKGTELHETERVIRDAHAAGISVRVTMIIGYPGENREDIRETSEFLSRLDGCIERVVLNRFQFITGAPIHRKIEESPERFPGITRLTVNHREASVGHHNVENQSRDYRRTTYKLIGTVHRINRRPISRHGKIFEGVM